MRGAITGIVMAVAIMGISVDAFAMGGGGGRKHGSATTTSSGGDTSSYTAYEGGNWEYSSTPVASAPEPGTIILLASGITGLALWARRRK